MIDFQTSQQRQNHKTLLAEGIDIIDWILEKFELTDDSINSAGTIVSNYQS